MKQRVVITVSRKWNNPRIETTINDEGISLSMSLEDFAEALLAEIGSVAFTVTKGQFKDKVRAAIERVITGIKEESAKVV